MKIGSSGGERLHKGGADLRGEDFGIVKVVGLAEEGVGEREREVEDAVDHWPENGTTAGFIDAEANGDGFFG